MLDRRLRIGLRVIGGLLVASWFLAEAVRSHLPFWVPFAFLLAAELELLAGGIVEMRRGRPREATVAERRAPGPYDADLGWGELVEEPGEHGDTVVRWVPPPPRPPRRTHRFAYAIAISVAAGLLALAYRSDERASWSSLPGSERRAAEARFAREAGAIARRTVRVACDEGYAYTGIASDALGVAFPSRGLAYLLPSVCRTLAGALAGSRPGSDDAAEAVLVLAHEAVHLRGERREGVTECLALQEGVALAERLGWSRAEAARLMRRRYEAILVERSITRLSYVLPPACRNGGRLDQRPADPVFP